MAMDSRTREEYAMKFFLSATAFNQECELYETGTNLVGRSLASFLPQVLTTPVIVKSQTFLGTVVLLCCVFKSKLCSILSIQMNFGAWTSDVKLCRFIASFLTRVASCVTSTITLYRLA